jgi:hypothetical protein
MRMVPGPAGMNEWRITWEMRFSEQEFLENRGPHRRRDGPSDKKQSKATNLIAASVTMMRCSINVVSMSLGERIASLKCSRALPRCLI